MENSEKELKWNTGQDAEKGFFRQAWESFNWDDFFYSLLLGLVPSTLDIVTDLRFASVLDKGKGSLTAAGLAYAIIIMPSIDFTFSMIFKEVWDKVGESHLTKICVLFIFTAVIGLLLVSLFFTIIHTPTYLFYPAMVSTTYLLGIKLVATLVHTPAMKRLSCMASSSEGDFEAAYQLLLILLTWVTGGGLHLLPMATSILAIGKFRAEKHLGSQADFEMHERTFEGKVLIVAAHVPIFSLAAVFRMGSLAFIFGSIPDAPNSVDSNVLFQGVFFSFQAVFFPLMPLLLRAVSYFSDALCQLTALQACQGMLGKYRITAHIITCSIKRNFLCQVRFLQCPCGQVLLERLQDVFKKLRPSSSW